jgi:hypothetical protein
MIYLVPEPTNPHDSKALVILDQQSQVLGYVSKEDNEHIRNSLHWSFIKISAYVTYVGIIDKKWGFKYGGYSAITNVNHQNNYNSYDNSDDDDFYESYHIGIEMNTMKMVHIAQILLISMVTIDIKQITYLKLSRFLFIFNYG